MEKRALAMILLLFIASFLVKLHYMGKAPFIEDETLYAEMIAEESESLSLVPRYFGYPAPWKPGLYFLIYSFFLPLTSALFSSLEWIYRFPNLVFSLISAYLVFLLAKRFLGPEQALLSSLLFFSAITSFYVETRLLIEPMMLALILSSLFFYTKTNRKNTDFIAAGFLSLLAALTKSVISLCIPLLALIYVFTHERWSLKNPVFLVSMLGAPAGLVFFFLSLSQLGFAEDVFLIDIGQTVIYNYSDTLAFTLRNLSNIFSFIFLFLVSLIVFFSKKQKPEPLLSAWLLLIIIPLLASTFRTWYLYYFIPPLAMLASSAIMGNSRLDWFSLFLTSIFVVMSIGTFAVSFADWEAGPYSSINDAKQAGLSLAGEGSTLFVGSYYYNTVAICYKSLEERRVIGEPLDFGYLLVRNPYGMEDFDSCAVALLENYTTDYYEFEEKRFAQFFWNSTPFRKSTGIREFRILVSSPPLEASPSGYSEKKEYSSIAVYRKGAQ
ncbi:hypothetical protein GF415_01715 [Candidatus Micrarchaeota archaeon]|nr:hypothetical protein [Candidatus Micrarchaeota archaeon]